MGTRKAILVPNEFNKPIGYDFTRLDLLYFMPSKSIISDGMYKAQQFKEIYTYGYLETTLFLRDTLKKIDILLEVNGKIIVEYYTIGQLYSGGHYIRPLSFLQYEISLSFHKRFKLVEKKSKQNITILVYEKILNSLHINDSIDAWTFGIVSDGKKDERIKAIIGQIKSFNIPNFEILICGPKPKFELDNKISIFDDTDLYWDLRIPITAKKNRIIFNAKFENIILMHDRISFDIDWFRNMKTYGNNFEILCNRILDENNLELRIQDWLNYERDFVDYQNIKSGSLDYKEWNPTVYVDGGFIIAKTQVLKYINGYNEALNWGEAEDVDLSKRLYQAGFMTNIDLKNHVFSQTNRHKGIDKNRIKKRNHFFYKLKGNMSHYINLKKQRKAYLKLMRE